MASDDPMAKFYDAVEFFYSKPWSDGLPIVPPTRELVAAMLEGTRRDPDEELGLVPPNFEPLTVRRIAEHAVMAGALPEYMPVIIGGMQAILDEKLNMHGVQTTIHGVAPLMIVNGPYAKKIGLNGGRGCFGPGHRAEYATIGRTVRLILYNVGGGYPSASFSCFGQPSRYTFCIAENEEGESVGAAVGRSRIQGGPERHHGRAVRESAAHARRRERRSGAPARRDHGLHGQHGRHERVARDRHGGRAGAGHRGQFRESRAIRKPTCTSCCAKKRAAASGSSSRAGCGASSA